MGKLLDTVDATNDELRLAGICIADLSFIDLNERHMIEFWKNGGEGKIDYAFFKSSVANRVPDSEIFSIQIHNYNRVINLIFNHYHHLEPVKVKIEKKEALPKLFDLINISDEERTLLNTLLCDKKFNYRFLKTVERYWAGEITDYGSCQFTEVIADKAYEQSKTFKNISQDKVMKMYFNHFYRDPKLSPVKGKVPKRFDVRDLSLGGEDLLAVLLSDSIFYGKYYPKVEDCWLGKSIVFNQSTMVKEIVAIGNKYSYRIKDYDPNSIMFAYFNHFRTDILNENNMCDGPKVKRQIELSMLHTPKKLIELKTCGSLGGVHKSGKQKEDYMQFVKSCVRKDLRSTRVSTVLRELDEEMNNLKFEYNYIYYNKYIFLEAKQKSKKMKVEITRKILINGCTQTPEAIHAMIRNREAKIRELKEIEHQPKSLQEEIASLGVQIGDLVKICDEISEAE